MRKQTSRGWATLTANAFKQMKSPSSAKTILGKIAKRIKNKPGSLSVENNLKWIKKHCTNLDLSLDQDFDQAELTLLADTTKKNEKRYENGSISKLGGGGAYPLLYWIVRKIQPLVAVETGVAAGYSSNAILMALEANKAGHLYSSDFPYLRLENAESHIGLIVDKKLKTRWTLLIKGDRANLPKIHKSVTQIDLIHYDSDKTYKGRKYAIDLLQTKSTSNTVIVMDDIQDNAYFHDYVSKNKPEKWSIIKFDNKFVGIIGIDIPSHSTQRVQQQNQTIEAL